MRKTQITIVKENINNNCANPGNNSGILENDFKFNAAI